MPLLIGFVDALEPLIDGDTAAQIGENGLKFVQA
jgi:hypothetical protein